MTARLRLVNHLLRDKKRPRNAGPKIAMMRENGKSRIISFAITRDGFPEHGSFDPCRSYCNWCANFLAKAKKTEKSPGIAKSVRKSTNPKRV